MVKIVFAVVCALGLVVGAILWAWVQWVRPQSGNWRPIYQGIEYMAEEVMPLGGDSGRMMALRIDLDAPGLELFMRPVDRDAISEGGQYYLSIADFAMNSNNLSVLMNTTIFTPGEQWLSYPGNVVTAVDTVVSNGKPTHYSPHSYMFWVDKGRTPHLEETKPPDFKKLTDAVWGIGLQGVQVSDGQTRKQAIDGHYFVDSRTFIGFDATKRQLFLLAFEEVTPLTMMDYAVRLGVKYGGALDSGSATHLILDGNAKGLRSRTGIRGGRPLGPYLGIRARPLP